MSSTRVRTAIAHVADGRADFFARREQITMEEIKSLDWLRDQVDVVESPILNSIQDVRNFRDQVICSGAQSLVIHIPIWADPIFTIKLFNLVKLPILLLGNDRPDTSSLVGLLGAGGALDQIGASHVRILEHSSKDARMKVLAFLRAAATKNRLCGQTLGLFGGRSLGIFTATADPSQWQQLFGIDIETLDQCEIVHRAEELDQIKVQEHFNWLTSKVGGVVYSNSFTSNTLQKQIRSYLATRELVEEHGFDFVGVKCQPEMCDGYVSQCISHCLMNNNLDMDGGKTAFVHACESDADGALTMQILNHLSEGKPTALLDMRWYNAKNRTWILANCGAIPAAFFASEKDSTGFSELQIQEHVFGQGGGGAISGTVQPGFVTLARLCRKNGEYWMAIVPGETIKMDRADMELTTSAFPQATISAKVDESFAREFGSNHIHMVNGDYSQELVSFCQIIGIPWKIWK